MNPQQNQLPTDWIQRKQRSENVLRTEGIAVNLNLPVIESEITTRARNKTEVAYRAMCLIVVALKGNQEDQEILDSIMVDYGLTDYFSAKELDFFQNPSPSEQDCIQFTWRYEAANVLFWALNFVPTLGKPNDICDVSELISIMQERSANQFISDATARPISELLDQADLIYRYRWAIVDAQLKGLDSVADLNFSVALERHYALNWLIQYFDQDWDDIGLDT